MKSRAVCRDSEILNISREADHALSGALQVQKELKVHQALKRVGAQRQEKFEARAVCRDSEILILRREADHALSGGASSAERA